MSPHRVVGLDLSLTSTGIATRAAVSAFGPGARRGVDRLRFLADRIVSYVFEDGAPDLVVIEGPSYGNQGSSRQSGHHERAGLWWLVRVAFAECGTPVAVVPPATLKKYATGKGNADKTAMAVAAFKRLGLEGHGDDEVDAAWLRAMGLDHLGDPYVTVPEAHRVALAAVEWPPINPSSAQEVGEPS